MKKTSPAAIRSTLNILAVQMERDGSKIDISCSPLSMISFGGAFFLLVVSRPFQHQLALAGVPGHRRRALELLSGLFTPSELLQHVGARRWHEMVSLERRFL